MFQVCGIPRVCSSCVGASKCDRRFFPSRPGVTVFNNNATFGSCALNGNNFHDRLKWKYSKGKDNIISYP